MWTKAIFRTSSHSHPPVRLTLWYTFHKMDSIPSVVILYYDYFLTFDDEVRFFWGRKWSSITFLFFFNRYFPLAGHIPGVVKVLGSWSVNVSKLWVTLIAYSDWHLTTLSARRGKRSLNSPSLLGTDMIRLDAGLSNCITKYFLLLTNLLLLVSMSDFFSR